MLNDAQGTEYKAPVQQTPIFHLQTYHCTNKTKLHNDQQIACTRTNNYKIELNNKIARNNIHNDEYPSRIDALRICGRQNIKYHLSLIYCSVIIVR